MDTQGVAASPEAQCERLLSQLLEGLDGTQRETFCARIGATLAASKGNASEQLRMLKDLDIYLSMPGPAFMYARGIAETLRVGEELFELVYCLRRGREYNASALRP